MNYSQNNSSAIKRSFDWVDNDKDSKISILDIQSSFNIQKSEAQVFFESFNPSNPNFISFAEFSAGLQKFPSILSQFQEETSLSPKSPNIKLDFSLSEDCLEDYSSQLSQLNQMKKSKIMNLALDLFNFSISLKGQLNEKTEFYKSQNFENQVKLDSILNEKNRIEENFEEILNEHEKLEKNYKDAEEQVNELQIQVKFLQKKCKKLEKENESIGELKGIIESELAQKDKIIVEMTKKLNMNNSLSNFEEKVKEFKINSNVLQKNFKLVSSQTPQGTKKFDFDDKPEFSHPKDKIIKNLEKRLETKNFENEKLEKKVLMLNEETNDLKEKVKLLSFSKTVTEGDDDTKSEVMDSLRDELFRIDPAFGQGSRFSVLCGKGFREVGVQVQRKELKKQVKRRYFCLSLF